MTDHERRERWAEMIRENARLRAELSEAEEIARQNFRAYVETEHILKRVRALVETLGESDD